VRAAHVAGGAVGGAAVGLVVGGIGALLGAGGYSTALLGVAGAALLLARLRSNGLRGYGLDRQVPRNWDVRMRPLPLYAAWGAMLGSGVATLVPYLCFFMLIAAEATVPVTVAVLAGAIYGGVRQAAAVALASGGGHDWIMITYERLRPTARRLDVAGLVVGSAALVALSALA
jgi:hypothetical protein